MTYLNGAFDCREKLLIFWEPADLAHLQNYSQRKKKTHCDEI